MNAAPRASVWVLRNAAALAACTLLAAFDAAVTPARVPALWWLAGGLAFAAVLRWGLRVWPGVAVAALLSAWMAAPARPSVWAEALAVAVALALVAVLAERRSSVLADTTPRAIGTIVALAAGPLAFVVAAVGMVARTPAGTSWSAATFGEFAAAWAWTTVGTLVAALPALAVGLSEPVRWSRGRQAAVVLAAIAVVAGALLALGPAPEALTGFGAAVAGTLALLLFCDLLLGSAGLALLAALAAAGTAAGRGVWATAASPALFLAADLGWALAALLLVHVAFGSEIARWRRWAGAVDRAGVGVAEWPPDGAPQYSDRWRALSPAAVADDPAFTGWLEQVHPDDRSRVRDAVMRLRGDPGEALREELRLPAADGWRWFELTLGGSGSDAGHAQRRLLATLTDSTERREAHERLRLSANLFQHLHEGLLVTDGDLNTLDVNPAYSELLGVPREELMGKVPALLRLSQADPLARQQRAAMWTALQHEGHWRGELAERRRNGEICTLQTTISTLPGPDHSVRYHLVLISDITEQRQQRERLERQAHYDELTRLPNRARLAELLAEAVVAADRDGYLLAVCYLDVDRFKPVNDRFGHAAGDRLLAELAGRLRSALRSRDLWADAAARIGGDEFVLLLRAGTVEEARLAVERVLRVVAQPYAVDPAQDSVQVTASVGATIYPIDRSDPDTLLRHADHAMYDAKQAGRNGYLFFDPEHRRRAEQRVLAIGRVQEALDRAEFVLYYQPKVNMRTHKVLGLEALLRWDHPQQGLIAPQQFLPLIDNTGLSARIGDWVFSQALEHLEQWRRSGLDLSVSVNVSARHLQERDFAQRLAELLARHAEPLAPWLELEMLETAAHADIEAASALLARCRALGVRCALDDFGTGYSTLTYLKRLPVDVLKIDRSFVHHMLDDEQDCALVEGVIGLARTFSCTVVAEGVESPAQARRLMELGCDIGQGTGIAAPMPASNVAGWVQEWKGMFALAPAESGVSAARLG